MKHANCVVSTMFAKTVRVAPVAVLVLVLAVQKRAAVSSQKANPSVARWVPMQRIRVPVLRVLAALPLARSVRTTPVRVTIISATAPKRLVHHVLPEIVHKVIVRHFKIVVRARRVIAHKVIVRLTRIVVRDLKAIVHKVTALRIRTVARVHHARQMPTQPNSAAGMCPMVSIPAHV